MQPDKFVELTSPFRAELLAHCYRMTGSVHDAEDLVQETLLRAWRAYDGFAHRASVRTWLHRIATNACLNALERGPAARVLPSGLGEASADPYQPLLMAGSEVAWLQPLPDRLLGGMSGDPAEAVITRETIRLAFVAALQILPARQRAILILRDVLAWPAAEVADLLVTSTTAVNGALLRARRAMAQTNESPTEQVDPEDPKTLALLDRYVAAFERADMEALTELLRVDAEVQMPPHTTWFRGREPIKQFFAGKVTEPGQMRMIQIRANRQPAFATFLRGSDGTYRANSLHVLSFHENQIHTIIAFLEPALFALFDLPQS